MTQLDLEGVIKEILSDSEGKDRAGAIFSKLSNGLSEKIIEASSIEEKPKQDSSIGSYARKYLTPDFIEISGGEKFLFKKSKRKEMFIKENEILVKIDEEINKKIFELLFTKLKLGNINIEEFRCKRDTIDRIEYDTRLFQTLLAAKGKRAKINNDLSLTAQIEQIFEQNTVGVNARAAYEEGISLGLSSYKPRKPAKSRLNVRKMSSEQYFRNKNVFIENEYFKLLGIKNHVKNYNMSVSFGGDKDKVNSEIGKYRDYVFADRKYCENRGQMSKEDYEEAVKRNKENLDLLEMEKEYLDEDIARLRIEVKKEKESRLAKENLLNLFKYKKFVKNILDSLNIESFLEKSEEEKEQTIEDFSSYPESRENRYMLESIFPEIGSIYEFAKRHAINNDNINKFLNLLLDLNETQIRYLYKISDKIVYKKAFKAIESIVEEKVAEPIANYEMSLNSLYTGYSGLISSGKKIEDSLKRKEQGEDIRIDNSMYRAASVDNYKKNFSNFLYFTKEELKTYSKEVYDLVDYYHGILFLNFDEEEILDLHRTKIKKILTTISTFKTKSSGEDSSISQFRVIDEYYDENSFIEEIKRFRDVIWKDYAAKNNLDFTDENELSNYFESIKTNKEILPIYASLTEKNNTAENLMLGNDFFKYNRDKIQFNESLIKSIQSAVYTTALNSLRRFFEFFPTKYKLSDYNLENITHSLLNEIGVINDEGEISVDLETASSIANAYKKNDKEDKVRFLIGVNKTPIKGISKKLVKTILKISKKVLNKKDKNRLESDINAKFKKSKRNIRGEEVDIYGLSSQEATTFYVGVRSIQTDFDRLYEAFLSQLSLIDTAKKEMEDENKEIYIGSTFTASSILKRTKRLDITASSQEEEAFEYIEKLIEQNPEQTIFELLETEEMKEINDSFNSEEYKELFEDLDVKRAELKEKVKQQEGLQREIESQLRKNDLSEQELSFFMALEESGELETLSFEEYKEEYKIFEESEVKYLLEYHYGLPKNLIKEISGGITGYKSLRTHVTGAAFAVAEEWFFKFVEDGIEDALLDIGDAKQFFQLKQEKTLKELHAKLVDILQRENLQSNEAFNTITKVITGNYEYGNAKYAYEEELEKLRLEVSNINKEIESNKKELENPIKFSMIYRAINENTDLVNSFYDKISEADFEGKSTQATFRDILIEMAAPIRSAIKDSDHFLLYFLGSTIKIDNKKLKNAARIVLANMFYTILKEIVEGTISLESLNREKIKDKLLKLAGDRVLSAFGATGINFQDRDIADIVDSDINTLSPKLANLKSQLAEKESELAKYLEDIEDIEVTSTPSLSSVFGDEDIESLISRGSERESITIGEIGEGKESDFKFISNVIERVDSTKDRETIRYVLLSLVSAVRFLEKLNEQIDYNYSSRETLNFEAKQRGEYVRLGFGNATPKEVRGRFLNLIGASKTQREGQDNLLIIDGKQIINYESFVREFIIKCIDDYQLNSRNIEVSYSDKLSAVNKGPIKFKQKPQVEGLLYIIAFLSMLSDSSLNKDLETWHKDNTLFAFRRKVKGAVLLTTRIWQQRIAAMKKKIDKYVNKGIITEYSGEIYNTATGELTPREGSEKVGFDRMRKRYYSARDKVYQTFQNIKVNTRK